MTAATATKPATKTTTRQANTRRPASPKKPTPEDKTTKVLAIVPAPEDKSLDELVAELAAIQAAAKDRPSDDPRAAQDLVNAQSLTKRIEAARQRLADAENANGDKVPDLDLQKQALAELETLRTRVTGFTAGYSTRLLEVELVNDAQDAELAKHDATFVKHDKKFKATDSRLKSVEARVKTPVLAILIGAGLGVIAFIVISIVWADYQFSKPLAYIDGTPVTSADGQPVMGESVFDESWVANVMGLIAAVIVFFLATTLIAFVIDMVNKVKARRAAEAAEAESLPENSNVENPGASTTPTEPLKAHAGADSARH